MGVKGASVLLAHRPFNVVAGVVVDAMHCVFLGVMSKTLIPRWCEPAHRSEPYSIRRNVCYTTWSWDCGQQCSFLVEGM